MSQRRAFTVLEIVVAMFMLAVMAAAVIPALMGRVRDAQKSALSQTLFSLSLAVFEFRKAVSVNPGHIVQLGTKPVATDVNACNQQLGSTNANNWRGPYVTRELVASGLTIGDARISNVLRRDAGPPVVLFIDVEMVDSLAAMDIDSQYDGTPLTPTTGTVRWQKTAIAGHTPPIGGAPDGMVNLSYGIPITGC